jgi:hypothetical protein
MGKNALVLDFIKAYTVNGMGGRERGREGGRAEIGDLSGLLAEGRREVGG